MADGDLSVISEGPTMRKYRHRTSYLLLTASYIGLLGLLTIIIAFSSPYWLSSHKYTYSSFVRLGLYFYVLNKALFKIFSMISNEFMARHLTMKGLWTFCFDHYKYEIDY